MRNFLVRRRVAVALALLGAGYVAFLIYIHDTAAGDFQQFMRAPFDPHYGWQRWHNWSSRLLIESSVNLFAQSLTAWKLVSMLAGATLFASLGRILRITRLYQALLLASLMLTVNLYILTSAGIFATTINYLWPAACLAGAVAMLLWPFQKWRRLSRIIMWPLYIYAVCSEQMALLALLLGLGYVGWLLYKKQRISLTVWLLLLIAALGVVNALISPGNAIRTSAETAYWWPGFDQLSLRYKLEIGSIATLTRLLVSPELPAVLLVLLLPALAYKRRNLQAFVASLPTLVICSLFVFPATYGTAITDNRIPNYLNEIGQRAVNMSVHDLPAPQQIKIYLLVFAVVGVSILATIVLLYGRTTKALQLAGPIVAGLAVAGAVSLSPTLFASSTRTIYPLALILVAVDFVLVEELCELHFGSPARRPVR